MFRHSRVFKNIGSGYSGILNLETSTMGLIGRPAGRDELPVKVGSRDAGVERDSTGLASLGNESDGLGPARAVVFGVSLGSLVWAGIVILLVLFKPEQITFTLPQ
jgi:hypothetical protein